MSGLSWQATIYDIMAIIVPGAFVPLLSVILHRESVRIYDFHPLAVLSFSFFVGHVIQTISRIVDSWVNRIWRPTGIDEDLRRAIDNRLREIYGDLDMGFLEKNRKDLCYSPVWDRIDNYKVFLAVADFNRACATMSLILITGSVIPLRESVIASWPWSLRSLLLMSGLLLFALFSNRSRHFRQLADRVLYYSFLFWSSERSR